MKKTGKALLILAGLSVLVGGIARFLIPESTPWVYLPFGVAALFVLIEIGLDFPIYKEFFTLKTTKHGMNMGVMILLVMVLLAAVNFIAVKQNKKWDLTSEKIHTLSDQTVKLLKGLDSDLELIAFFREDVPEEEGLKFQLKSTVEMLQEESGKVKYNYYNAIKRPDLVKEYNVVESPVLIFKYKGKVTTINEFTEEKISNAIVKVTREQNKRIALLSGHGELTFEDMREGTAGALFKKALEDSSYDVQVVNLVANPKIPEGTNVLVLAGPRQPLLEPELKLIEDFLAKGGSLFVAVDPGQKHGLAKWLTKIGVTFDDNYIIDQVGQLMGQSAALAVGMQFSTTSEITRLFENQLTAFELASSVAPSAGAPSDFRFDEIVKSSPASFSKNEIAGQVQFDSRKDKKGPLTLALTVTGSLSSKVAQGQEKVEGSEGKKFSAVVVGDSDFLSNRLFPFQLNRDFALNAISYLAKDEDLISIKPKQLATTKLAMTNTQASLLVLGVYLPIPFLFLIAAGVIWWRRRGA